MNQESHQNVSQSVEVELEKKISLCHDARNELQAFDRWVSELNARVQSIPSAMLSGTARGAVVFK